MTEKRFSTKQLLILWRIGNAAILLLVLFLAWEKPSWSDMPVPPDAVDYTANGWDVLSRPKTILEMKPFLEEMSPNGYAFRLLLGSSLKNAILPIAVIGYSVFCIEAVFRSVSENIRLRKISILTLFILLIATYPLWHNPNGSWGYYISIFGFISSALLELYSSFWAKIRIQPNVPKAGYRLTAVSRDKHIETDN